MFTKVQVDFFMPTGYEDTYVVETQNRGYAVERAMAQYPKGEMAYVNIIQARHVSEEEGNRLVDAKRATLLKVTVPPEE